MGGGTWKWHQGHTTPPQQHKHKLPTSQKQQVCQLDRRRLPLLGALHRGADPHRPDRRLGGRQAPARLPAAAGVGGAQRAERGAAVAAGRVVRGGSRGRAGGCCCPAAVLVAAPGPAPAPAPRRAARPAPRAFCTVSIHRSALPLFGFDRAAIISFLFSGPTSKARLGLAAQLSGGGGDPVQAVCPRGPARRGDAVRRPDGAARTKQAALSCCPFTNLCAAGTRAHTSYHTRLPDSSSDGRRQISGSGDAERGASKSRAAAALSLLAAVHAGTLLSRPLEYL